MLKQTLALLGALLITLMFSYSATAAIVLNNAYVDYDDGDEDGSYIDFYFDEATEFGEGTHNVLLALTGFEAYNNWHGYEYSSEDVTSTMLTVTVDAEDNVVDWDFEFSFGAAGNNSTYTIEELVSPEGAVSANALEAVINYTQVSEVPVPAAAWLFGSALVGLAGIKRKK